MTTSLVIPAPATPTAHFTWRELLGPYTAEGGMSGLRSHDAERDALGFGNAELRRAVAAQPDIGGVMLWNRTLDTEYGDLVMLTAQDCDAERRVVDNAPWMVSCGAIYAIRRIGLHSYKTCPDIKFRVGGRSGDLVFAWLIPNDRDVPGLRR